MMGRLLMYATIAVLALFVVSTFTLLEHGNEGLGLVRTYTPHELPLGPAYDESAITLDGTLTYNEELDIYEVTDEQATQPALLKGLSAEELTPYIDTKVHINGTYIRTGHDTWHVEADTIRPFEPSAPTPTVS